MILFLRKIFGLLSPIIAPHYGCCRKCGVAWKFCKSASVRLNEAQGFIFLCVYCYKHTAPSMRVFYFRSLYNDWQREGAERDFTDYENAILRQV